MRRTAALLAALGALAGPPAGAAAAASGLPGFLEGTWEREVDGRIESEQWIRVHPRLLVGSGAVRSEAETRWTEHLVVIADAEGVRYVAAPEGQAPTAFRLVSATGAEAVFENPAHDFPQRIVYRRDEGPAGPRLHARIEGPPGGPAPRAWTWHAAAAAAASGPPPLVRSAVVPARPAEVFAAFTTRAGVRTFFAPDGRVEAREGGAYELWFMPAAPEGSRGSEGCRVIELVPERLVAFTWNFPPTLPALRPAHTLVTVALAPAEGGGTTVTVTHAGFRSGAAWEEGRGYFERAWGLVLDRLRQRFAAGPVDWSQE